jgi:hypothetical protein
VTDLVTATHKVGYAQGMNDILSMILAVIDHEADAYWCFKFYMLTVSDDFQMQGMVDHIGKSRSQQRAFRCDVLPTLFLTRFFLFLSSLVFSLTSYFIQPSPPACTIAS